MHQLCKNHAKETAIFNERSNRIEHPSRDSKLFARLLRVRVVCAVYDKLVKYITTVFYYVGDPDL